MAVLPINQYNRVSLRYFDNGRWHNKIDENGTKDLICLASESDAARNQLQINGVIRSTGSVNSKSRWYILMAARRQHQFRHGNWQRALVATGNDSFVNVGSTALWLQAENRQHGGSLSLFKQ